MVTTSPVSVVTSSPVKSSSKYIVPNTFSSGLTNISPIPPNPANLKKQDFPKDKDIQLMDKPADKVEDKPKQIQILSRPKVEQPNNIKNTSDVNTILKNIETNKKEIEDKKILKFLPNQIQVQNQQVTNLPVPPGLTKDNNNINWNNKNNINWNNKNNKSNGFVFDVTRNDIEYYRQLEYYVLSSLDIY
jgi:hypothetical protein